MTSLIESARMRKIHPVKDGFAETEANSCCLFLGIRYGTSHRGPRRIQRHDIVEVFSAEGDRVLSSTSGELRVLQARTRHVQCGYVSALYLHNISLTANGTTT